MQTSNKEHDFSRKQKELIEYLNRRHIELKEEEDSFRKRHDQKKENKK